MDRLFAVWPRCLYLQFAVEPSIFGARIHAILAREARERNGRMKKKNTFVAGMAIL